MAKKDFKEIKGDIATLLKDTDTIILMTDSGALFDGSEEEIMYTLAHCVNKLYMSDKINKECLKRMLLAAMASEEELDNMLKEELEKLKGLLEEIEKDNKDE